MSENEPEATKGAGNDTGRAGKGPDRRGGGTGNAGGTDLHAMAMVAAAVHLMRGTRIGWLEKVANDIPMAISAESGGPGDDIALELAHGGTVEIQCKKNLQRGDELWDALDALIDGIADRKIDHGVLAVAPDSSGTIKQALAADIIKIGQGVEDPLSDIGLDWLKRLKTSGRSPSHCANIRIQTLDLLESQGGDRRNAVETLRTICADPERAEHALSLMYCDAVALMRSRGRWTLASLVTLLRSQGLKLRDDDTPASIVTKLSGWTEATRGKFYLPAGSSKLSIEAMLPAKLVAIPRTGQHAPDASTALDRYHSRTGEALDRNVFDGQWTGRYRRLNVIVAGPGMGKSTLANRLAWEFARDGIPVLAAPLKRIAAAMKAGIPFEKALEQHGLDGSGIDPAQVRHMQLAQLVVIVDGLDEAGMLHDEVSAGLFAYAAGHPQATIIVTTRPIGYETARLAEWRHYRLEPPNDKEGHQNLGRLLAASRDLDLSNADCIKVAKRELDATPARDAIVVSPLLLGMSAALIIQNERLPSTKPEIYEAMISLFEGRDITTAAKLAPLEAARTLDIIGWELTDKPLLTWEKLQVAGCGHLASDLKQPTLAVARLFAQGFDHWERAGIVEKVHHAGTQLVTFVHKTFGEFAAARFLCSMGKDQQRIEMERMIDLPALGEVVAFAGALGLGNDLAQLYLDRRGGGVAGQFELALALAADRDTQVDDAKTIELAEIAFAIAATEAEDRFSIGVALSVLAKARFNVVGPIAQSRLDYPEEEVRLIAWAAAVAAGEAYYDISKLEPNLEGFVNLILGGKERTPTGIRANLLDKKIDLVQSVAIAALKVKPVVEMVDFVATKLSDRPFTSIGFVARVEAVLIANGIEPSGSLWKFPHTKGSISTARIVADLDNRWPRRANRVMRAVAIAVAGTVSECGDKCLSAKRGYPEFSSLYELLEIGSTVASDLSKWEEHYDEAAVAEAIRGLIAVSRIDASQLAVEAREIVDGLEADPFRNVLNELSHPDIPAPEWRNAAALHLDRNRLEGAFSHGSIWLMVVAAKLLAVLQCTKVDCSRLLERAQGSSLFYAVQIVAMHVDEVVWRDLLLERLKAGLDNGTEYILAALADSDVPLVNSVGQTVTAGMRSGNDKMVEAAAKLGLRWLKAGGTIDADAAKSAYRESRSREAATKGGWLVTEIRAELLKLLIAAGSLDEELLRDAINDGNSTASEIAKQEAKARGL